MNELIVGTNLFSICSFMLLSSTIYIIGVCLAVLSWRRYRFSALIFIPIVLLWILPPLIFPIYIYAEYNKRKETSDYDPREAMIVKKISWLPLIFILLTSTMLGIIFEFGLGIAYSLSISVCSYSVCLLAVLAFLWVKQLVTKKQVTI